MDSYNHSVPRDNFNLFNCFLIGTYICKAKNKLGEAQTTCSVEPSLKNKTIPPTPPPTPESKPEIKKPLLSVVEVQRGQPIYLETVVQASAQSDVQWTKDGNALSANVNITLGKEPIGANTNKYTLLIKNPEPVDEGTVLSVLIFIVSCKHS